MELVGECGGGWSVICEGCGVRGNVEGNGM